MTIQAAEDKMTIHDATDHISFDGNICCYKVGFINGDGDEDETELTASTREELEGLWDSLHEEFCCQEDNVLYVERVEPQIFVVDVCDSNEDVAATFGIRIFESGVFNDFDAKRMMVEASRDYLNVTAKRADAFTYMDFYRDVPNEICRDHGFEKIQWDRKRSDWQIAKGHIQLRIGEYI